MQVPVVERDADVTEIVKAIDEAGCVVIDRLVAPELIDSVECELRSHLDVAIAGPDDFSGLTTRRTGSLIARSETFRDLAAHPVDPVTVAALLRRQGRIDAAGGDQRIRELATAATSSTRGPAPTPWASATPAAGAAGRAST